MAESDVFAVKCDKVGTKRIPSFKSRIKFTVNGVTYTGNCMIVMNIREARWPSGRASDSGARGRGLILTQVAALYP